MKKNKVFTFIEESIAELKKVIWPSRDEVGASTKVVIISVALIGITLGFVDYIFIKVMEFLF